eukprot:COSAG04_NODE_4073_length_2321_cov_2.063456_4_plen_75_part_00
MATLCTRLSRASRPKNDRIWLSQQSSQVLSIAELAICSWTSDLRQNDHQNFSQSAGSSVSSPGRDKGVGHVDLR